MIGNLVGAVVTLIAVGFIAQFNSGAIVGSVLAARSGWKAGIAFLGGTSGARAIQGLFGLGVVYAILDTFLGWLKLDTATYTLMLLAGIAVVTAGARRLVSARDGTSASPRAEKRPEPTGSSARTMLVTGLLVTIVSLRQWIFTSLAVSTISALKPGLTLGLVLAALYLAVASWMAVGLLATKALRPQTAERLTDRIDAWTEAHLGYAIAWAAVAVGVLIGGYGLYELVR